MRMTSLFGLGVLTLSLSPSLQAQFTPVIAKTKEVHEVWKDGKLTQTHIREGTYLRASDGSVLEQLTAIDGDARKAKLALGGNILFNNQDGSTYRLDLSQRKAYAEQTGGHRAQPDDLRRALREDAKPHPEEWVGNVKCEVVPVKIVVQGSTQDAGKNDARFCESAEYGLILKREMSFTHPDGHIERTVFEMYDVELGKEPDATLFDVRSSFTVVDATTKK